MARNLSRRLPNVYVTGLGGISFAVSQLKGSQDGGWISKRIADLFGAHEGFKPTVVGDHQLYLNGQRVDKPATGAARVPPAGAPGQALGRWR